MQPPSREVRPCKSVAGRQPPPDFRADWNGPALTPPGYALAGTSPSVADRGGPLSGERRQRSSLADADVADVDDAGALGAALPVNAAVPPAVGGATVAGAPGDHAAVRVELDGAAAPVVDVDPEVVPGVGLEGEQVVAAAAAPVDADPEDAAA